MSYLELGDQKFTIPGGEGFIGKDPDCTVQIGGDGVGGKHAAVQCSPGGQVSVRVLDPNFEVRVNGVPLGPQPHPLIHGDKIAIGAHELLYVEESQSGSTQFVSAADLTALTGAGPVASASPKTAASGGRLVCLTDGREYTISGTVITLGREAGNDIVVASKSASRNHAEIKVAPNGYVFVDKSTNGSVINDKRVSGERLLSRGDVIKIGDEEFRFYADKLAESASPSPGPAQPPMVEVPPPVSDTPPEGAEDQLRDTLHGVTPEDVAELVDRLESPVAPPAFEPATPPSMPPAPEIPPPAAAQPPTSAPPPEPAKPEVLANLFIRSGELQGQRLPIRVPVVNIGRAEYNDLVIPDASVSTVHAKIQRREGIWILMDLDSTNGSFVDGERVVDEVPLAPAAVLRFGEVKAFFEPRDDSADIDEGKSTKVMGAIQIPPQTPPTDDA